jgi:RNA polymerase sigma factor (sigma-70 family)
VEVLARAADQRLTRRFGGWVPAEKIGILVGDATLEGIARFDETLGVPLGAFLLTCVVRAVYRAVRRARQLVLKAYRGCALCSEWWLTDPTIVFGTDEERLSTLEKLAQQGAMAMVVAGAYGRDIATGGEDAMIEALDLARVRTVVGTLNDRKREVLEWRYGERAREEEAKGKRAVTGTNENGEDEQEQEKEPTLKEIAKAMGLGEITVRRAHAEALDELRARLL